MAGFVGQIGFIEMSKFYTNKLEFIWMGYASQESIQYNSILIDLQFDNYDTSTSLTNYGFIPRKTFNLNGAF